MIIRGGQYWQTLLADLALILFIVSASSLDKEYLAERAGTPQEQTGEGEAAETAAQTVAVAEAQNALSLSIWRNVRGSPPLGEWLEYQARDPRMSLVIAAEYAGEDRAAAWDEALFLASEADEAGVQSRIEMRPGTAGRASVSFEYDGGLMGVSDGASGVLEAAISRLDFVEGDTQEPEGAGDTDETGLNFAELFAL